MDFKTTKMIEPLNLSELIEKHSPEVVLVKDLDGNWSIIGEQNLLGGFCNCCSIDTEILEYALLSVTEKDGAPVVEQVDTPDLESGAVRCEGSTPSRSTNGR